jgi:hypothetical protein
MRSLGAHKFGEEKIHHLIVNRIHNAASKSTGLRTYFSLKQIEKSINSELILV